MSKGIIVLCGSTRFYKLFDEINYKFTINDYIVLSIGCHSQSDYCLGIEEIESKKEMLDLLHKEKIAMADAVFVLDYNGYIGDSTRSEIAYARQIGKPVYYYSENRLEMLVKIPIHKRKLQVTPIRPYVVDFKCRICNDEFRGNDTSCMDANHELSIKMKVHEQKHPGDVSNLWVATKREL